MTTPVNPILVVQNNLPEYRAELLAELDKAYARAHIIEQELRVINRLQAALELPPADGVDSIR